MSKSDEGEKIFGDAKFQPPWREVDPKTGELGEPYGPGSPSTYAKQIAAHKNWANRPENRSNESKRWDSEALYKFMHDEDGIIKEVGDVTDRQRDCYHYVYECGHSIRWVAKRLKISRESVRTHLARLRAKAGLH